jgi:hypothetical protein
MHKILSSIMLFILFLSGNGWSATYYVNQTGGSDANNGLSPGSAWKTIAKVNGYSFYAGDNVYFKKGETWSEELIIPSSGSAGSPITFGAYGESVANPIIDGGGSRATNITATNKSYITIQDLSLNRAGSTTGQGLKLLASGSNTLTNITVQRVTSKNHGWDGFIVQGSGSLTETAKNIQFLDCVADNNGRTGYHVYNIKGDSSGGVIYRRCTSTYAGQLQASHGFSAYITSYIRRYNCESSYTNISPANNSINSYGGKEGIGFAFDDYVHNSFDEAGYSHHNAGAGIVVSHRGDNNAIRYSISALNGKQGIIVNGETETPQYGNNNAIYNNTIYGNGTTHAENAGHGIDMWATVDNVIIKNNIITENYHYGIHGALTGSSNIVVDYNLTNNNGSGATLYVTPTHAVTGAPKYVNASAFDYRLLSSSPAIDAGTGVGLSRDFVGNPVPLGSAPDIGAYEYTPLKMPVPPRSIIISP